MFCGVSIVQCVFSFFIMSFFDCTCQQQAICTKRSCDIVFMNDKVISFCLRKTIKGSYLKQTNSYLVFQTRTIFLKEQYPVTAHAPNFDFWTGCREIKRCEESKRTLKNPFASRLAGFNTTIKLLRITDQ